MTAHSLESSIADLRDYTCHCSGEVTNYHGSFSPFWCTNVPVVSMSRAEICFRMPAALSDAGMPVAPKAAVMSVATMPGWMVWTATPLSFQSRAKLTVAMLTAALDMR
mmetsp:Transcript_68696/g.121364  ORF Transcript_68696/g.121364 Transcript_68696/m.121364 type:complete len:108 (+) Transcript_68696:3-326(+)